MSLIRLVILSPNWKEYTMPFLLHGIQRLLVVVMFILNNWMKMLTFELVHGLSRSNYIPS